MFDSITGTYTRDLTDTVIATISKADNFYKGWSITLNGSGSDITYFIYSQTDTEIILKDQDGTAVIPQENGNFTIDYVSRETLSMFESDMENVNKLSDELMANKINMAKVYMRELIKKEFRFLYNDFPDDAEPLDRILNLGEVLMATTYYVLHLIYIDWIVEQGDNNEFKANMYRAEFDKILSGGMALLTADIDDDGELSNEEKGTYQGVSTFASR